MKKSYQLIRSKRKTLAINITPSGDIVVKAPYHVSLKYIQAFIDSKAGWIERVQREIIEDKFIDSFIPTFSEEELRTIDYQARQIIPSKVSFFARALDVQYNRIAFRRQHTRWGSCSSKGNLNFNILLVLLPEEVMDYVIVHELCHLKEMNHSKAFWDLVESIIPDYRARRQYLADNGRSLTARLP